MLHYICEHVLMFIFYIDTFVRLVGGSVPLEGRVEVYNSNSREWGTVCGDFFDINDANVVCKELGYARGILRADFGPGSGPIWLDDVDCVGTEPSIHNCIHSGFGNHNCSHSDDVGVECQCM